MTEFEDRLRRAVERGDQRQAERAAASRRAALNEAELRTLHTRHRLALTEHIDLCLKRLTEHFPGFQSELVFGDRGWGTAILRDDLELTKNGTRGSGYSRLEMAIRPFSDSHVLDLAAKGTVKNREVFHRNHFAPVAEADPRDFMQLIDTWVVEYAEYYAAHRGPSS